MMSEKMGSCDWCGRDIPTIGSDTYNCEEDDCKALICDECLVKLPESTCQKHREPTAAPTALPGGQEEE